MTAVARSHVQHDDPLRDNCIQRPFIYPQPQAPPSRDSKKAQKMLGLVTEFQRPRSATLEIRPLRDATKAKRTLGLVTDLPRDRRSWRASVSGGEGYQSSVEEMLANAERDVRVLIGRDEEGERTLHSERSQQREPQSATRGWIDIALEREPELLETPPCSSTPQIEATLQQSPSQFSPLPPSDVDAELARLIDLPPPLQLGSSRPRPLSFASSNLQIHNRRHNRIASSRSRGLRANSYPNFSRPMAPKPVPGEEMERDPLYLRYQNEPPTPASPVANPGRNIFDGIVAAKAQVEEHLKRAQTGEQLKNARLRPKKARWSSLPTSLMNFAKRRSSKTEEENLGGEKGDGRKGKIDLTEDNLQRWEDEVGYVPKMYRLGYDILRSPVEGDMEVERGTSTPTPDPGTKALPELPKLENLSLLTPPSSPPQGQQPFATSSKPTTTPIPRPFPPSFPTPPLDGSNQPTLAAQKEYLSNPRSSLLPCTICKEPEHPATFPLRRITSKCTHTTRTCKECIQQWVETCVETRGWNRCTCPECGEAMSYDDVRAFVGGAAFVRYDELATRAALSSLPDFHWCQSPACTSGQIHTAPLSTNPVFTCSSCGHIYCLSHPTVPYHTGLTCAQFDAKASLAPTSSSEKALAEKEGQRTVQETSKRCPNAMCGWWIQKNEGCDHMTCWKCHFEFCWECGAAFARIDRKGARYHKKGCRYWG